MRIPSLFPSDHIAQAENRGPDREAKSGHTQRRREIDGDGEK